MNFADSTINPAKMIMCTDVMNEGTIAIVYSSEADPPFRGC